MLQMRAVMGEDASTCQSLGLEQKEMPAFEASMGEDVSTRRSVGPEQRKAPTGEDVATRRPSGLEQTGAIVAMASKQCCASGSRGLARLYPDMQGKSFEHIVGTGHQLLQACKLDKHKSSETILTEGQPMDRRDVTEALQLQNIGMQLSTHYDSPVPTTERREGRSWNRRTCASNDTQIPLFSILLESVGQYLCIRESSGAQGEETASVRL